MTFDDETDEAADSDWANDSLDADLPDEAETEDSQEAEDLCPFCRRPIYHDVNQCPRCGQYVSEAQATKKKPLWILLAALLCIVIILLVWVI